MTKTGLALCVCVLLAACPQDGPGVWLTAPTCVTTGQTFTLNASLPDFDGPVEHWRFDMGDGSAALITPGSTHSHIYRKPGRFTMTARAQLADGRTSKGALPIDVEAGVAECGDGLLPMAHRFIDVDACVDRGVLGCLVNLGSLEAGVEAFREVLITNPGTADTRLETMDVLGDGGDAFTLVQPERLTIRKGGNDVVKVGIRFTPRPGTYHVATLRIRSNAENLPEGQDGVRVVLTGAALDAPVPRFEIIPPRCDVGSVVINERATCDLTFRNTGTGPLHVVNVQQEGDARFRVLGVIPLPLEMPPQSSEVLRVELSPQEARAYAGNLLVATTDPVAEQVVVELRGVGIEREPVAVPRVESINGLPALPDQAIRPLNDVVVTGLDSRPGREGRRVVGYRWEMLSKPDTSTAQLSTPDLPTTGFMFSNNGVFRPGLDVIGDFVLRLTVTDDGGLQNLNDGRLVLSTTAGRGIHVQLTWDDAFSDIDLHVMRRSTPQSAFGGDDCFYSNCTSGGDLNWGGGDRNPSLDIDDTNGFGPENTRVPIPEMGRSYLVGVHFYARGREERRDIPCRVQVFVDGQQVADQTRVLTRCNSFWSVGIIRPFTVNPWQVVDSVEMVEHASCREN